MTYKLNDNEHVIRRGNLRYPSYAAIPPEWMSGIRTRAGKVHYEAIHLLAYIDGWYKPVITRDPTTNLETGMMKRFAGDTLNMTNAQLMSAVNGFGHEFTENKLRTALATLKRVGVLIRKQIKVNGFDTTSVLPDYDALERMTRLYYKKKEEGGSEFSLPQLEGGGSEFSLPILINQYTNKSNTSSKEEGGEEKPEDKKTQLSQENNASVKEKEKKDGDKSTRKKCIEPLIETVLKCTNLEPIDIPTNGSTYGTVWATPLGDLYWGLQLELYPDTSGTRARKTYRHSDAVTRRALYVLKRSIDEHGELSVKGPISFKYKFPDIIAQAREDSAKQKKTRRLV